MFEWPDLVNEHAYPSLLSYITSILSQRLQPPLTPSIFYVSPDQTHSWHLLNTFWKDQREWQEIHTYLKSWLLIPWVCFQKMISVCIFIEGGNNSKELTSFVGMKEWDCWWISSLDLIESVEFIQRQFLPIPESSLHLHTEFKVLSHCIYGPCSHQKDMFIKLLRDIQQQCCFSMWPFGIQCLKRNTVSWQVQGKLGPIPISLQVSTKEIRTVWRAHILGSDLVLFKL